MTAHDVDHAVASLARCQHGVVARGQVYAAGGSAKVIRSRLGSGLWVPLDGDVFALLSHPGTWKRQLMAAVLAQREAMIVFESAATFQRLADFRPGRPGRPGRPDVLVPRGSAHKRTLARVHEGDAFQRTMVSMQRRFLTFAGSRRPGLRRLVALIETYARDEAMVADSMLEFALDAMLVGSPVIVEADGRSWHTRVADFATDRRRDNVATRHGFDTLRYTYGELVTDPGGVSAEIGAVHGRYQSSSSR